MTVTSIHWKINWIPGREFSLYNPLTQLDRNDQMINRLVMWMRVVELFATSYQWLLSSQYLLEFFWGWLLGPHCCLSPWGSTDCPAKQRKLGNLTAASEKYVNMFVLHAIDIAVTKCTGNFQIHVQNADTLCNLISYTITDTTDTMNVVSINVQYNPQNSTIPHRIWSTGGSQLHI